MSVQVQTRRKRLLLGSATAVAAVCGMTGDLIFSELKDEWALGAFAGAALVVAGLTVFLYRHSADDLAVSVRAGLEERHQLPPERLLVGREALSSSLIERLRDVPTPASGTLPADPSAGQAAVTVVHGAAGTGKTTLALYAAHRVKKHYPDGQLYVDLRGGTATPRDSGEVLEVFLRNVGTAQEDIPRSVDDRATRFRSLTNAMRLLIVLDNAHSTEQIQPLLPVGPGCSVLVTSRRSLSAGNITRRHPLKVELPAEDQALEILSAHAGRERVAAEPAAALDIVQFCGRLPLALRIVGGKISAREDLTLRRMRARLEDERARLHELVHENESLQACLSLIYRDLPESARQAFGLMSSLPVGTLTDWHVGRSLPTPAMAGGVCDELVGVGLMEAHRSDDAEPSYGLHDLVRVFAREQYKGLPPEERRSAEQRLVGAYREAVVYLAAGRAPELGAEAPGEGAQDLERETAGSWVAGESERIQWAIARARRLGMEPEGAEIAEGLTYFLDDVNLSPDSARWLFDEGAEQRTRVVRSLRRGRAVVALGNELPDAALELFLPGGSTDPAVTLTARDRIVVARAYAAKSDYPAALDHMTTAVGELRAENDPWHVQASLEKLGEFQRWRGQPEKAEESQREALRLAEGFGDRRAQARLRRTLAETLGYLRRPEEAAPLLEQAIRDFGVLNDRVWEARSQYALGKIYRLLARRQDALEAYNKAEDILGPMGERQWIGRIDNARIRVYAGMERFDDAWASAQAALGLFRQLGDDMWYAHTQRDIGLLHLRQGRPGEALAPLTEAIEVTRRAGDAYAEAMARHLRGVAHRGLGQLDEARSDLEAALAIYQGGAYDWNQAVVLHDLIRALRADGASDEADRMESSAISANPAFVRMPGRDGAQAIPDED
ncbi:tetratricopeptide repeat protein [Streptomyces sp. NBC_01340]|uniref:tetratricopeptide repeat protein n=1 Tax=Streptomyces sp. NBC_01340 TaxID=2903830 RepID=UPI002E0EFF5A|nr:tetratricopeptide repeat protein [Streptomyces sp. NBC_01340]